MTLKPIKPNRWCVLVFFFQAEDGIRDWSVTGVQTCALPILLRIEIAHRPAIDARERRFQVVVHGNFEVARIGRRARCSVGAVSVGTEVEQKRVRSEERRVGKECRSRWSQKREKNEKKDKCME